MTHDYSIMLPVGTNCLIRLPAPDGEVEDEVKDEESNKTLMQNRQISVVRYCDV